MDKRNKIFSTSKIFIAILCLLSIFSLSACNAIKHFDDWRKTTDDGFEYYYNEYSDAGAYILGIPDVEDLVVPEYIDGKKVVELGHCDMGIGYKNDYIINGNNTKKLTIQHQFSIYNDAGIRPYANFPNLANLIFIDFLYCNQSYSQNELIVPYYIGGSNKSNIPIVELKKSEREFSLEGFKAKVIIIPDYVELIEAGVFEGLTDVTIKASFESKPEGWQDGWNGACTVEWGVELS